MFLCVHLWFRNCFTVKGYFHGKIATMTAVACKELKNRLGKYLDLVRKGDSLQVTDRGKTIACILPLKTQRDRVRSDALARLIARGSIRLPAARFAIKSRPSVLRPGNSIVEMIAEDRR